MPEKWTFTVWTFCRKCDVIAPINEDRLCKPCYQKKPKKAGRVRA